MSFKITSYKDIPENVPVKTISGLVSRVQQGYRSFKTVPLAYRKQQLRNLYYALYDNQELLYETMMMDINKSKHEVDLTETYWAMSEILHFINNLEDLAGPKTVSGKPVSYMATDIHVHKQPLGTVLIISPWNYPLSLTISPLAAAIAAGNSVVLKLSELCPNISCALAKILKSALDPSTFDVVTGGIPQSTELLAQKWDKIMYTGNGVVGRVIARAAAENLTPTLLELGGKSPVVVTKSANLQIAARRVMWGKQTNSGQTCVAPDYILVEKTIKKEFLKELEKVSAEFGWGKGNDGATDEAKQHKNYSHIINARHFNRLSGYLKNTKGNVVIGGEGHMDESSLYFPPTIVTDVVANDSLMKEEIFGPLLPMIDINGLEEAVDFIVNLHDTPLALYIFSNDVKEQEYLMNHIRSGGVGINDTLMHVNVTNTPFGGIGESGYGSYHGVYGFDAFSHLRTVLKQPTNPVVEQLLDVRYPPYTNQKNKMYGLISGPSANPKYVPRTGPVRGSSWGVPSDSFLAQVLKLVISKNGVLAALVVGIVLSKLGLVTF